MTPRILSACEHFQPAQRECWAVLLCERLSLEPDARERWSRAIEEVTAALWAILPHDPEVWLQRDLPELPRSCFWCDGEEALAFYSTGRRAFDLILRELELGLCEADERLTRAARMRADLVFTLLLHRHLHAACSACGTAYFCAWREGQRRPETTRPYLS